ncbi:MAG: M48 family metalloprotease [Candidatus Omnitrophica bacterium]|nr:M48 family metalloprotease [Candidatus Omnitrophota bacterium]
MKQYRIPFVLSTGVLCIFIAGCGGLSKRDIATGNISSSLNNNIYHHALQIENKVRAQYVIDTTSPRAERLQRMVARLQHYGTRKDVHSSVGIITDQGYANSCTGGQHIFIGTSLINAMQDDDLVAFILAHEIAHVDKCHAWRTFAASKKRKWLTWSMQQATNVGVSLIPTGGIAPVAGAVIPTGVSLFNKISSDIIHNGFSRSFEYEADYDAACMMAAAGYDPRKAVAALERLDTLSKDNSWLNSLRIFSTHPETAKRAEQLAKLL